MFCICLSISLTICLWACIVLVIGGEQLARKPFTTTIDIKVQKDFKDACSKQSLDMNEVLEPFMKDFIDGKFYLEKEVTLSIKRK